MFGITRGTTAGHIARAAVESIAYQVADLLDAMRRDSGNPVQELRVDGGAAANDSLMQFQADILGVPVVRPAVTETTALRSCEPRRARRRFLALRLRRRCNLHPIAASSPAMPPAQARSLRDRWTEAVTPIESLGIRQIASPTVWGSAAPAVRRNEVPRCMTTAGRHSSLRFSPERRPLGDGRQRERYRISAPHSAHFLHGSHEWQKESFPRGFRRAS